MSGARSSALWIALGAMIAASGCGAPDTGSSPLIPARTEPALVETAATTAEPASTTAGAGPPASATSAAPLSTAPMLLRTPSGITVRVARGAALDASSPLRTITALHGMCYTGEDLCTLLRPLAEGRGVLVCPTGNGACADGSPDWIIPTAAIAVRESTATALDALGDAAHASHDDVLFGSSRGAYAACELVYETEHGPWSALVLVGASVDPDADKLRRGGIRRVLLAAPEFDVAAPAMRRAQKKLCRAGMPARFVELGAHGHGLPEEGVGILAKSMDWVIDSSATDECARGVDHG